MQNFRKTHKSGTSLYRPFSQERISFLRPNFWNHRVVINRFGINLPHFGGGIDENLVIWLTGIGVEWPFHCLATDRLTELLINSLRVAPNASPSTPTTRMAVTAAKISPTGRSTAIRTSNTATDTITKWDIFHYVYGLLHHPGYRERYQANLKRELPRIPFAPDFRAFAAGRRPPRPDPRRL